MQRLRAGSASRKRSPRGSHPPPPSSATSNPGRPCGASRSTQWVSPVGLLSAKDLAHPSSAPYPSLHKKFFQNSGESTMLVGAPSSGLLPNLTVPDHTGE